ncbi:MAG: hypothetical protein ABIQ95_07040 [Bdellovibrionia bacterium]
MLNTLLANSGLKKDASWANFVIQCLALAFILHLIAAVRSAGFYHVDEHFQIVEFMNYKLGRSPAVDLPLEYGQLMRPWLMSAIFAGMTQIWKVLGSENPFGWAMGYRLFCAGLGFISTALLVLSCYRWFPLQEGRKVQWRTYAVLALSLIWFLPALHARHSSENVSGSVFFIAISLLALYLPVKRLEITKTFSSNWAGTVGVLFGLAFEFRYQTGFMILGALLWLIVIARIPFRTLLIILAGALIPVALGTLADRWGYGQWTFAPWNYVKYNLVQNHVSDSEVTPWWDYFRRALTESWPPLGLILLLSFPIAWLRNPKHILTWSMVPLFLTHEIIGHKELRFLFPLIHAGPVLLVMSIQTLQKTGVRRGVLWKKLSRLIICRDGIHWAKGPRRLAWIIVGINTIALIFTTLLPAWSPIRFYEQLYHFKPYGFQLYYKDSSLFDFGGAKMNFYKPTPFPIVQVKEYSEIVQALKSTQRPLWIFTPRLHLSEEIKTNCDCQVEFSTLPTWPSWIESLNLFGMSDRITNWTLHRCKFRKRSLGFELS